VRARGVGDYLGMIGTSKVTAERLAELITKVSMSEVNKVTTFTLSEQVNKEDAIKSSISFIDQMASSVSYP